MMSISRTLRVILIKNKQTAHSLLSTDCHLTEALRELKKASNPSKVERAKLFPKLSAGIQPGGEYNGRAPSVRQLRLSNQIRNVLSTELIKTGKGSIIDISEVSLSRDLRNVTIYWLLDHNHNDEKTKLLIDRISIWLDRITSKLRFKLTLQVSFKYSPSLIFRFDKSRANARLLDELLKNQIHEFSLDNNDDGEEDEGDYYDVDEEEEIVTQREHFETLTK